MGGQKKNRNKNKERAEAPGGGSRKPTVRVQNVDSSDDERDQNDAAGYDSDASYSTHLTFDGDLSSIRGESVAAEAAAWATEQKLQECAERATNKNVSIRLAAFGDLQLLLSAHAVPDVLGRNKATVMDAAVRALRTAREDEATQAALLTALCALQLGDELDDEALTAIVELRRILADPARSDGLRTKCSTALVDSDDLHAQSIDALQAVWTSVKAGSSASADLLSASLAAWQLLLLDADLAAFNRAAAAQPKLVALVDLTQSAEMRVSAAEAAAFLHEVAVAKKGDGFKFDNEQHLLALLAHHSGGDQAAGQQARRTKRVQRMTYKQVAAAIARDEPPQLAVHFAAAETLALNGCADLLVYKTLCDVLRGGTMQHLKENPIVRSLFGLGEALSPDDAHTLTATDKRTRAWARDMATKSRQQTRAKQRDRRDAQHQHF